MIFYSLRESYSFVVLIIPIIMIILSPTISLADAERIFEENSSAVVVIITYNNEGRPICQGTGFIVRHDGAIVTNYHVISNAADIKVKSGEKILEVEGLLYIDKENDIVILKVRAYNLPVVILGDIKKTKIGEKVYVISSPRGFENTISEGILSGIREIKKPKGKFIQITAPVSEGSSGGPVFNKNGEVVGIITFLIKGAQNINFAIPVILIKDKISAKKVVALKDAGIVYHEKPVEPVKPTEQPKVKQVTGEVKTVDATAKTIAITKMVKGKDVDIVVTVDDKTKITMGKEKKALADVKVGDKVKVKYEVKDGNNIARRMALL